MKRLLIFRICIACKILDFSLVQTHLYYSFFVFRSTEDIDLYVGGIAERPVPGGNVGRTFGCIIGYQFRDLRKGDKYWFENPTQFSQGEVIVFGFCSFQVHD